MLEVKLIHASKRWKDVEQQQNTEQHNPYHINPLRAKFFRGNINMYLHLMSSFLNINMP